MFGEIKRFFKSTVMYGLVGSLRSFVEFLLLPLYSRYLLPADFGQLDVVLVYLAILAVFARFELTNAAFRFHFEDGSPQYRRRLTSTVTTYLALISGIALAASILFSAQLSSWLFQTTASGRLFIFAGAYLLLESIYTYPLNLFRIQDRPQAYVSISLVQIVLTVAGTIVFVAFMGLGLEGVLLAKVISTLPTLAFCLWRQRSFLRPHIDFSLLLKLAKFSAPLIPAGCALWAVNALNRSALLAHVSLDQIGLFAIAMKFTVVITLAVLAVQLAWPQFAFSNMHSRDAGRIFARVFTYYAAGGAWLLLVIAWFGDTLLHLQSTPAYFPAGHLMLPLALGSFLYGCFYIFSTGVSVAKRTALILLPVAAGLAVNLIANHLLAPAYGALGVAWATPLTYLVMAIVMLAFAQPVFSIPFEWGKLGRVALLVALLTTAHTAWSNLHWAALDAVKVVLLCAFPVCLVLLRVLDRHETTAPLRWLGIRSSANRGVSAATEPSGFAQTQSQPRRERVH